MTHTVHLYKVRFKPDGISLNVTSWGDKKHVIRADVELIDFIESMMINGFNQLYQGFLKTLCTVTHLEKK